MAAIDPTILYAPDFVQRIQTDEGAMALQRFLLDLYNRVGGPEDVVDTAVTTVAAQGDSIDTLETTTTSLTAQIAANDTDIADIKSALNTIFSFASNFTISNDVTDRTYDADATTVAELADVLATLIADIEAAQPSV